MYGTALKIAQQAAAELGLPVPTDLTGTAAQLSVEMAALINAAGTELLTYWDWQDMLALATITTVAGQALYTRPLDFYRQVNQTIWDGANTRPVAGPVSPQGWQALVNSAISGGPFASYRVIGDKIEISPVPTKDGQILTYNYIRDGWVQSGGNPNIRLNMVQTNTDTPLFDFWLMVKFLKLKLWQAKGLDTIAYTQDFQRTFNVLTGQDQGAPVLSLSPMWDGPYITVWNVPEGNW